MFYFCVEIWTKAALPYKGFSNQKVWVEVLAGYRLPCPEGCPQNVHDTMLQCWKVLLAICVLFHYSFIMQCEFY